MIKKEVSNSRTSAVRYRGFSDLVQHFQYLCGGIENRRARVNRAVFQKHRRVVILLCKAHNECKLKMKHEVRMNSSGHKFRCLEGVAKLQQKMVY